MILDELAAVLEQVDPVPDAVLAAAEAAFSRRGDNWHLMTMLAEPAGMRCATHTRLLAFDGGATRVDVQLDTVPGAGTRVLGLVHPAGTGSTALVRWPDGGYEVDVDTIGWFRAEAPPGPMSIVLRRPGRAGLSTGWFVG